MAPKINNGGPDQSSISSSDRPPSWSERWARLKTTIQSFRFYYATSVWMVYFGLVSINLNQSIDQLIDRINLSGLRLHDLLSSLV